MNLKNRYKLFQKGEEKYLKELDVEYFATTMRKVHMLISSLMDDKQRFLSNYQHLNFINLEDSSGSSSDSDFEGFADKHFKKVPKILSKDGINQHSEKIRNLMVTCEITNSPYTTTKQ
jgi:hypothetical protein